MSQNGTNLVNEKTAIWVVTSIPEFDGILRQNISIIFTNSMTAGLTRFLLVTEGPKIVFLLKTLNKFKAFAKPKEL